MFQLAQGVLSDPSDKTKINLVCGLGNDSDIMFKDLRDVTPPTLKAQTRARISRSRVNIERDSRSRASESILGGELRLDMEGLVGRSMDTGVGSSRRLGSVSVTSIAIDPRLSWCSCNAVYCRAIHMNCLESRRFYAQRE
jgi:hypothetical protein